tara:strand:- start:1105 stop:2238 length:1134 start_codon:yes stop_codon:yes gene_type:complete
MNLIKSFLKSKKIFYKPKNKDILFFDTLNIRYFLPYLDQNNLEVLETRKKIINIFVLFKMLIKRKKINGVNYFKEYISIVNPKIIVSFTDNSIFLYEIKNFFPNIKILTIQNGMRNNIFFESLETRQTLKADIIFTWGKNISDIFKKYIDTKTFVIGSFINNQIKNIEKDKKNSISFISTGYERINKSIQISDKKFVADYRYYQPEKNILPILLEICKEKKMKLEIIGRCKEDEDSESEKNFYEKILGKGNFDYYPQGDKVCYLVSDKSRLSINIYSAFGLETLVRGNRCCFFNVRGKYCEEDSISCFWPGNFPEKGEFWSNEDSKEEIKRIVNFSLESDEDKWKDVIKNVFPNLIDIDENNLTFRRTIKKILDHEL